MKKTIFTEFFCKGKHHKKEKQDNLTAMLLPSVLGIILCAAFLVESTWAWFTATQSTESQTIQAASYEMSAVVKLGSAVVPNEKGIYSLAAGTYTVTLTAKGDATTGYCVVKVGNTAKPTQQFPSKAYSAKSITFTLVMNEAEKLELKPCWGTSTAEDAERIANGGTHTYGKAPVTEPSKNTDNAEKPSDAVENNTVKETTTAPYVEPTKPTQQTEESTVTTEATTTTTEATEPETEVQTHIVDNEAAITE